VKKKKKHQLRNWLTQQGGEKKKLSDIQAKEIQIVGLRPIEVESGRKNKGGQKGSKTDFWRGKLTDRQSYTQRSEKNQRKKRELGKLTRNKSQKHRVDG